MALWLFRRKSRRKRSRGNLSDGEGGDRGREAQEAPPTRRKTVPGMLATETVPSHQQQQLKKRRTEPNKLQRRARTYSFSPGRNDSIRVDRKSPRRKHEAATHAPSATGADPAAPFSKRDDEGDKVDSGVSALGEDVFPRPPTLHNKRDGEHLMPRKKSSKKRRKEDHAREAEIKAMSNFMPVRPATDAHAAGRPMKKDSHRVRTGFVFPFGKPEWDKENRSSDISLPIADSIHSSLSSDSEHISYKVSTLEALAPRPTLRYAVHPRGGVHPSGDGSLPARVPSQRKKLSEREPYPEATIKAHKRVDDLANDLSASDLRELMERDQRRRERRRQKDQETMERRLARRADKQRSDEALATASGREPPPNLERGVVGRELVGLGIDTTSAVVTSSRRRSSEDSPAGKRRTPSSRDDAERMDVDPRPQPLDAFHRTTSIVVETPISPAEIKEPVPPPVPPKGRSFLRPKKSRSKSPPASDDHTEPSEKLRKGSESSSSRAPMSWTSIFRWGTKSKRNSGPSSFSNTSRDSMPAMQQPNLPVAYVPPRKPSTGFPRRTMSRFREDLPELPLSPPDSRMQSPEVEPIPPTITEQSPDPDDNVDEVRLPSSPTTAQMTRNDTPTTGDHSLEGMRRTPTSWSRREDADPSPVPQSMSLASIDSEGSWLSGRLTRRRRSSGMPESLSRQQNHHREAHGGSDATFGSHDHDHDQDATGEEHSIADDEYLSRVARQSGSEARWKRKSTGEARPSSDEDEAARWGAVKGQQPRVIHAHAADKVKSREGLLNTFGEEGDSDVAELEGRDSEDHSVQRATSINLGKGHARHISAGSAKLLDLTPRTSVDAKRGSFGA